jgi:hypothetical protein
VTAGIRISSRVVLPHLRLTDSDGHSSG